MSTEEPASFPQGHPDRDADYLRRIPLHQLYAVSARRDREFSSCRQAEHGRAPSARQERLQDRASRARIILRTRLRDDRPEAAAA